MREYRQDRNLKKIFLCVMIVYLVLIFLFYYLTGDQLRLRESRGNIEMAVAETGTVELVEKAVVEQTFRAKIQRLQEVRVQFGSYNRMKNGNVTIELCRDKEVLLQEQYEAEGIQDGTILTLTAPEPIETVYDVPLQIRVSADSTPGEGVTAMMNIAETSEGYALSLNGEPVHGTLCFAASGTDYIWSGTHYWIFAAAFGVFLAAFFFLIMKRHQAGKHSYLVNAIYAIEKYDFLIRQLVARDFKKKYRRSILGVFWSFLNPLLMMLVQYFVFSTLFKSNIPNFAAYLISGTIMFNFFNESCGMTLTSILDNSGLITKVYMPKYIYPLTRTLSSIINFSISLIPMLLVCMLTGVWLQKSVILAFFFYLCLFIFSLGLGMLLCTSMVFFRDTLFLWNVLSMMWMYVTPIFYPESILPEHVRTVLQLNPLYHFIKNARVCILDGISPEPMIYLRCLLIALVMLMIGAYVFYKNQDKFVLYF